MEKSSNIKMNVVAVDFFPCNVKPRAMGAFKSQAKQKYKTENEMRSVIELLSF